MVWIWRKIEYKNSINLTGNCVHCTYGLFRFAKKLNIQNCVFHNKLCTLYVQIVRICRKIKYLELRKFNEKLCTLYVQNVWICRKIEYTKLRKFNGKLCALYVQMVLI